MPIVALTTLGCKVNQYETERIAESFRALGFGVGGFDAAADVYVVNSCSVTAEAERKSRNLVRRALRRNPGALVVLTGCMGELARATGAPVLEAGLVVPNAQKLETAHRVVEAFPALLERCASEPAAAMPVAHRTRATVKVQDGCSHRCSYCSIWFTRPSFTCRPADEILAEVTRLAEAGRREVVITGVLVGAYGPEIGSGGPALPGLLRAVAAVPGIARVRLSSVEVTDVTPELLEVFATVPQVCAHLHIPLQSGDDGVLRAMNRPYTSADYLRICRLAEAASPDMAITTDIIVGFPGEDDAAFANTVAMVDEARFARAHVFRFSVRPGTAAADLGGAVPEEVKEERARVLGAACAASRQRFVDRRVGGVCDVLVEPGRGDLCAGYTGNYIRVQFAAPRSLVGCLAPIRLTAAVGGEAHGELVTPATGP